MPLYESAPGRERAWNLLKKLGEGDAGEVYLVESILDKQVAILKRPRRSAFSGDVVRQASQIEREGRVLSALAPLDQPANRLHIPRLIDQSRPGTEFSDRYFIIVSRASGYDLGFLARVVRFGALETQALPAELYADLDGSQRAYLQKLAESSEIPSLILLRAISVALEFLDTIHNFEFDTPTSHHYGVIWNDVKPDHFFWEPFQAYFTLIDWGNAQFLETDGATTDRQFSRNDDYVQFLSGMGDFLATAAPILYSKLSWPVDLLPGSAYTAGIKPLKERVTALLGEAIAELRQVRQQEAELFGSSAPNFERFSRLGQVHSRIITLGEVPDYKAAEKFFHRLASILVETQRWAEFQQLCGQASYIPALSDDKWKVLGQISEHAAQDPAFRRALNTALRNDWASTMWELRSVAQENPPPAWWDNLSTQVRRLHLGLDASLLTPFVALNRMVHALQAAVLGPNGNSAYPRSSDETNGAPNNEIQVLTQNLREDVLARWSEVEPDPPDSGIDYRDIERYLPLVLETLPIPAQTLANALNQPQAQAKIVMDAWGRREFDTARNGLRRILLWDPDRLRLLQADRAIQFASVWLEALRRGPRREEALQDFVTRLELEGRDLRNQVGPAPWLDALLEALSRLRKGAEPANVLMEFSGLRNDLGWLLEIDPNRPILILSEQPVELQRQVQPPSSDYLLYGVKETLLGQEFSLSEPLDTWVPEARGSSARVFLGLVQYPGSQRTRQAAVKLMRPDRAEYALPLFREEVQILTLLRDIPGVIQLFEFGFIRFDEAAVLPAEDRQATAAAMTGRVLRYGPDAVHNYLLELSGKVNQGWIPYLAMEKLERANNLLLMCDTGYTRGRFLPVLEGLRLAIQICDVLEAAHARNIIYRDHKILHYYWQESVNGVFVLDWNIARRHPEGLQATDTQFDLVQFAARALHPILTGRSAPGALPLGPTRPDEIEAAERSYAVRWTYDDQRLPADLKDILERSLAGGYNEARRLREDLHQTFQALSALIPKEQLS